MKLVNAGADTVLFGVWLPAHTVLRQVRGEVTVESNTIATALDVFMGSVEAWVLPVNDPDEGNVMESSWDQLVPKDTSSLTMDMDTTAQDTTPFFEPGAVYWESLFDLGRHPIRLFQKQWMCSLGHNTIHQHKDTETPFAVEWVPGLTFPLSISRPVRVRQPSLLAFALASPDTTLTNDGAATSGMGEKEWGQVQFIDHVMERAMLSLLGLTEAGAETPWEEAAVLLKKVLDPLVDETVGATFTPTQWHPKGTAIIEFDVEGTMPKKPITTGR